MATGRTESAAPGEATVLVEEGGAAEVLILSRSDADDWVSFKIRFTKILRQYPWVPYEPGDEIEIGYNPKYFYQGGWSFDEVAHWQGQGQ